MTEPPPSQHHEGNPTAERASDDLKAALAGLGIQERHFRQFRPLTSTSGQGYVYLGLVSAEVARKLATALSAPALPPHDGQRTSAHPR